MRDFDPTASEYISTGYLARSKPGNGFYGDFGGIGNLVGGIFGASAASDAADAQTASAQAQINESRRQYDQTRADNAPWRDTGASAVNRLAYLLGVGGVGPNGQSTSNYTYSQLRDQLLPQYTKTVKGQPQYSYGTGEASGEVYLNGYTPDTTTIDNASLDAEIQRRLASQSAPQDSSYGSLLKKFGIEDFQADPGYAFRQAEGQKGVERSAASRGALFSGAAGKALTKYNQDLASQEYSNAYNRFNNDQSNVYNRLAGLSGIGQTAQGQVNQAGANTTASVNNALSGMGNAQAAGIVGRSNALTGALNNYQSYNQLNKLLNGGGYGGSVLQANFSQTGLGSSGFGSGLAYGNQDLGGYF